MLFDRFIFVVYILTCYAWFLLGSIYQSSFNIISIVSMTLSMVSIIFISFFQLQTLTTRSRLSDASKWSTIAWATVHMLIGTVFVIHYAQWANVVIILGVLGVLMTIIIVIVGGCACYTIIENGSDWHAHIHLTCISFWVIIQYMCLQLPDAPNYTFIPIVLMACLRFVELYSEPKKLEMFGWLTAIALHILYNIEMIRETFFWGIVVTLIFLCIRELKSIVIITALPFILGPLICYIIGRVVLKYPIEKILLELTELYEQLFLKEPDLMPFEVNREEEDWALPL